jgi:thiamine-phosphate pyrophosphorylase
MQKANEAFLRQALRLYFVMGTANCSGRDPVYVLEEAIEGGITMFQLREKGAGALEGDALLRLAADLQTVCRKHSIPFIVNDDVLLAQTLNADGIHVGQDDEPVAALRSLLGPHAIIGVSAHTPDEAARACADGADYLGIGPVFPTGSKPDAKAPSGTTLIERLRALSLPLPLVAIGGITAQTAPDIIAAGADGVAVISAIAAAPSPRAAAAAFDW